MQKDVRFVAIVTEGKWLQKEWEDLSRWLQAIGIILPQPYKSYKPEESALFGSAVILCRRSPTETFYCPLNVTGKLYGEPLRESVTIPCESIIYNSV